MPSAQCITIVGFPRAALSSIVEAAPASPRHAAPMQCCCRLGKRDVTCISDFIFISWLISGNVTSVDLSDLIFSSYYEKENIGGRTVPDNYKSVME